MFETLYDCFRNVQTCLRPLWMFLRPFISVETFIGVFKALPNNIEMIPELFEKILNVFETLPLHITLPDMSESLINMFCFFFYSSCCSWDSWCIWCPSWLLISFLPWWHFLISEKLLQFETLTDLLITYLTTLRNFLTCLRYFLMYLRLFLSVPNTS